MKRVHVLVEGQTEEVVVQQILLPHYAASDVHLTCSLLTTKRSARGPNHKGGVSNWPRLLGDITRLLGDTSLTVLTTLFDYYAFPADAPGMADRPANGTAVDRVRHVEGALAKAVNDPRFVPHLVLHETEAWVLCGSDHLVDLMGRPCPGLSAHVHAAGGPELVNDHPETAPSKLILKTYPEYRKTVDGPMIIDAVGFTSIRASCPHADERFTTVEDHLSG
ncbi:DUF4276 family protein [Actinocorallia lasiicapitis]